MRRGKRAAFAVAAAGMLLAAASVMRERERPKIVINEVCAHNAHTVSQKDVGSCDYIELYNAGEESVELEGYRLQKNQRDDTAFVFGRQELAPHSYAVVLAAGWIPESDAEAHIFAPWRISDGDVVSLAAPGGERIDSVQLPVTKSDTAYARKTDGSERWTVMLGSPYQTNDLSRTVRIADPAVATPVFSVAEGVYDRGFFLEIQGGGANIYYTLDGSEPDADDLRYTAPIWIDDVSGRDNVYCSRTDFSAQPYEAQTEKVDKCTVVRAVAVDALGRQSEIATASYFVGERFASYSGEELVSLVADPEDLFGQRGLYVLGEAYELYLEDLALGEEEKDPIPANYLQHGDGWERPGVLTIYGTDGTTTAQPVGLRLNGNYSRTYVQKSFRVIARTQYSDTEEIHYAPFTVQSAAPRSLLLRAGYGRNSYLPALVADRDVAVQEGRPCALFLDGEYWGRYSIQERCEEAYLSNHYGVPQDEILLIKDGHVRMGAWNPQYTPATTIWDAFQDQVARLDASGMDAYQELSAQIDMQSYIDYLAIQIYLGNNDLSATHNAAMWRSLRLSDRPYEDGKWRWIIYDIDQACTSVEKNHFTEEINLEGYRICEDPLFRALMRSSAFREQFVRTFLFLADHHFSAQRTETYLSGIEEKYGITCPEKAFFAQRRDYAIAALREVFPEENGLIDRLLEDTALSSPTSPHPKT